MRLHHRTSHVSTINMSLVITSITYYAFNDNYGLILLKEINAYIIMTLNSFWFFILIINFLVQSSFESFFYKKIVSQLKHFQQNY